MSADHSVSDSRPCHQGARGHSGKQSMLPPVYLSLPIFSPFPTPLSLSVHGPPHGPSLGTTHTCSVAATPHPADFQAPWPRTRTQGLMQPATVTSPCRRPRQEHGCCWQGEGAAARWAATVPTAVVSTESSGSSRMGRGSSCAVREPGSLVFADSSGPLLRRFSNE